MERDWRGARSKREQIAIPSETSFLPFNASSFSAAGAMALVCLMLVIEENGSPEGSRPVF